MDLIWVQSNCDRVTKLNGTSISVNHYQIYPPDSFRSMPWRNGLGHTIELLAEYLPASTEFAWRLSMADVVNDGRFSDFTGYDRTLLLLQGEGVTLKHADGQCDRLSEPLQVAHFNGEAETGARLHAGPIKDFNVMARRDFCSAKVDSLIEAAAAEIALDGDILLVYAVDDAISIKCGNQAAETIAGNHLLRVDKPPAGKITVAGKALIVIQISYLAEPASVQ